MSNPNIGQTVKYLENLQKESVGTFSQIQLNCRFLQNEQMKLNDKAKEMVKNISDLAANFAKLLYGEL